MPDMLVKLYDLPPLAPVLEQMEAQGIHIVHAKPWHQTQLREFIETHFSRRWADETALAFTHQPATCFVALVDKPGEKEREIVGFAAYECTCRDFFGPTGVREDMRGKGIGKALLLAALWAQREMDYGYSIIGWVGPADFYKKCVGAEIIPDSSPGVYKY